ncbi:hypothetical protein Tco_0627991 [Tanacetum coccineum]|uniref:Integrase, catalytic region, zinc finger, CCHC-type, peptidase aspartic, catalytic n=1 Tax=Tanacetum coccineum TaxID=301880 RepID=A0ABQ4WP21_9ASTR
MSNILEDIQCAGSDTRPSMLDRTDFESWKQRIRLYCLGKDNGENIMKSIREGPFQMGTVSDVITGGTEGEVQQGPVRARVLKDLSAEEKERYKADIRATNILLQGIPKDIYSLINHYTDAKDIWENLNSKFREQHVAEWSRFITEVKLNRGGNGSEVAGNVGAHRHRECPRPKRLQDSDYFKDKMLLMQAQESGAVLDEEQSLFLAGEQVTNVDDDVDDSPENDLALNVDHIFEADECDAFDSDVDECLPLHKPCSWQNLTSVDPIYDEAGAIIRLELIHLRYNIMMPLVDIWMMNHECARDAKRMYNTTTVAWTLDADYRVIVILFHYDHTVDHYKSKTEEVTLLKKDFKQKEDKFLEEFLDIKKLKDKIEDRLYKQDQSVQTVHMLCKPKSFYDEKHKVAIGYKNPLCLTRAKQVQPALYNGHVLVMSNHARPVVHDSEDTREISEITRKRMLEKMKSPLCVENKIRIAPPDYSKENFLATFAPQRNLTPEQIFWSIDDNNRKKAETLAPKPISALTVYPPNTPVKLVPRILPTKSQVKINLYVLTQLFTEFDKTCKTRITPSGLTEGERGFEQTKRCYLTEVIPFFKTLKEHFVGVQKALFKEVKEMEEIFDQMNNEVDKNTVDKQCAEIEKKNLLIENENLIVNCLSTQLLYDVEKSRCLDLEADMSKVHDESKLISKLERECLNLQLKYQHLQESFDNKNSQASQEALDFNSFFKIKNLEHQIKEKDNVIRHLKDLVASVNDRSREPHNDVDVTALIEQNDCDRVELEKVKQHYKELYDSIKINRAHTSEKTSTMLNEIESLKAQLRSKEPCLTSDYVKPKVLAPGMYAIDVKPIPHPLKNNRSAHLNYISHLKESVETVREIVEEARVVKPLDISLNYACRYTKLSQELLECVIGTCPKSFNERDNKAPSTPVTRKKQVTFSDKPGTSSSNAQKHKVHQRVQLTNIPVLPSTGVNDSTEASGSKPRSNTKKNRILPAKKENKKEVEVRLRTNKSVWTKVNRVDSSISSKRVVINSNSESVNSASHGMYIGYQWRPTGKKLTLGKLDCGSQWRPTGKKFALGEMCHLTKLSVKCFSDSLTVQKLSKIQIMVVANRRFQTIKLSTINDLARKDLVRGLPRLKFEKDHLCSACQLGKSKKFSHRPKSENTNMEVLHTPFHRI